MKNPYHGMWRSFGTGVYAIAGSDAKDILFGKQFIHWGGEDDDFFNRMRKRFHVVRAKYYGMMHHWHPAGCDLKSSKSCFLSQASLEGPPASFQLDRGINLDKILGNTV